MRTEVLVSDEDILKEDVKALWMKAVQKLGQKLLQHAVVVENPKLKEVRAKLILGLAAVVDLCILK